MPLFDLVLNVVLIGLTIAGTWAGTVRVLKKATTEGVSLVATAMVLLSVSTWLGYGVVMGNLAQVLTSAVAACGALVTLIMGYRTGTLRTGVTVGTVTGYATVIGALGVVAGIAAVGGVASILSTLNKVPQVVKSWKNPGGMAVSISSNVMGATTAAGWVLYGGMRADLFVVLSSLVGVAHGAYVAIRTVQGRRAANASVHHLNTGQHEALRLAAA